MRLFRHALPAVAATFTIAAIIISTFAPQAARAQFQPLPYVPTQACSISGINSACDFSGYQHPLLGMGSCTYTITSMGSGNVVTPKTTANSTSYDPTVAYVDGSSTALNTITTTGKYNSPCSNVQNFELQITTAGSGSVVWTMIASTQPLSLPGGGGGGGGTVTCASPGCVIASMPPPVQPSPIYTIQANVNTPPPVPTASPGGAVAMTEQCVTALPTSAPSGTVYPQCNANGQHLNSEVGPSTAPAAVGNAYQAIVDSAGNRAVYICATTTTTCVNVKASAADSTALTDLLVVEAALQAYNGTNTDRVRKDSYAAGPLWTTTGGSTTTACGAAANCSVKASAGRLTRIIITTVGTTGAVTCYDGTSATGTVIGGVSASNGALLFYVATFDSPAANGIFCVSAASGPAYTVAYY